VQDGLVVSRSDNTRRDPAAAVIARAGGQPIEAQVTAKPGACAICRSRSTRSFRR